MLSGTPFHLGDPDTSSLRFACLNFSLNHPACFACTAPAGTQGVLHFELSCNGLALMNCIGQYARGFLGKAHLTIFCRRLRRLGACAVT